MKNDTDTLKALYKKLKTTQKRLDDIESAVREPVAVIGMACRFPGGADTIEKYRALLEGGGDAVCDVPRQRWDAARYYDPDPEAPGKATTNRAGFLQEPIDGFDCGFFHLSPQEVQRMDPQQRMLLEVCWEAFENAAIDIAALKGSRTGVFCGIANSDYVAAHLRSGDPARIDAWSVTGTALSAAVGRISYLFGFEGPNMALDTACSSSLVAIHLAGRSLRSGESDLAVAAGINLMLTPEGHIGFSKLRAISADGRCKSFDDAADGYGRGEGCGVVLLKRLSDAEKAGDPVLAVIRGTAVNQDGRTNGFTAPSSRSQEKLLRKALAETGLRPEDIGYVEAHGTGTPLGDPIEMEALGKVYAAGRSMDAPLVVGSVKANIGHLEAAAGMAGFIKTVLVLAGGRFFPQIHFKQPNRHIPWQRLAVKIPTEAMDWPRGPGPRSAAVSSFGFSGTNAHAILQEADPAAGPQQAPDQTQNRSHHLLALSAADPQALAELAQRYHHLLGVTPAAAGDICFTAAVGRSHLPHRLALVGRAKEELRERLGVHLDADAAGAAGPGRSDRRIVFLFTGQGSQYHRMGWDLYQSQPLFRSVMERCDALLKPHMDRSLIDLLYGDDAAALHATQYTQPVIFCVEYALAELLASWGVKPSLMVGHSIGEYVAATIAGIFELEEVLGLVAARGRLVQSLPPDGGMAVIAADGQRVSEAIAAWRGKVSIAALNAPKNTVVSGDKEAIAALCARFKKGRVASHILNVSHAFHSCLLDPVVEQFRDLAAGIAYAPPGLPIMSNVTGRPGGAQMATADYWTTHLRQPVRFFESMRAVAEAGYGLFLEVGGTCTLTSLGRQCLPGRAARWFTTLGRRDGAANLRPGRSQGRSDWEALLDGLAGLYTAGCDIDWQGFDRPYGRRRVVLPNYPFQRKRCWMELPDPGARQSIPAAPAAELEEEHTPSAAGSPVPHGGAPGRRERIATEVKQLMYRCSEIEIGAADGDTNLFELGFASLMIARLKDLIKRTYGLEVQMSWFYNRLDTYNKTVDFIDRQAPADVRPDQAPAQDSPVGGPRPAAPPQGAADDLISRQIELMSRQLAVMSEQLGMLGGAANGNHRELRQRQAALMQQVQPGRTDAGSAPSPLPAPAAKQPEAYVAYRGVNSRQKLALDTRQQAYLKRLIDRYTGLTAGSKAMTGKYRPVFANTRNIAGFRPEWKEMIYQIIVDRAQEAHFTDIDGKDYLDISMGFGVYLFGHNPPFVQTALQRELQRGTPIGPMCEKAGAVATLIHELAGVERAAFFNTGTEAVMAALRIARTVTGRRKIVLFSGSYHGHFDGVLAVKEFDGPPGAAATMSPGTPPAMVGDIHVLEYDSDEALRFIEAHGRELAAVLVEPVQSRRPELQPKAFLKQLREITAASGTALIFDEMIVGFRTHPGGAQAWFEVQADIVTYGKVVGGGVPIGVVAGKARYLDAVDGGMWNYGDGSFPEKENTFIAGTFNHHPLAMAGAHAVLNHLKTAGPALQADLNRRTAELARRLNGYFEGEDLPIRMTHFGSLFRIPVKGDQELLYYHLLSRGIYIWEGRNCFLSTAHTDQDIDRFVAAVQESIAEMREGGLFRDKAVTTVPATVPAGSFPLSSAQHRMYIMSQAGAEMGYHIPVAVFIDGPLDGGKVARIFEELIQEHDILRSGFEMQDGRAVQKVHAQVDFSLEQRGITEDAVEETLRDVIRPFDLARPPLLRCCLARISEMRHLLILDAHHIVFDGISGNLLMGEFIRRYSGEAPCVPSVQYQDYVAGEQAYLEGGEYRRHEAYWLETFSSSAPLLTLPADFTRPPVKTFEGDKIFYKMDGAAVLALRRFARATGTSLHMTLFAAYFLLLHKLTGSEDVVVGATYDGRGEEQFADCLGMFVHTLPVRCRPERCRTFVDFLDDVKKTVLEAHDRQRYPFERLVEKLSQPREPSRNPLFDTMFVYETQAGDTMTAAGLTFTERPFATGTATFDLILDIADTGQELKMSMEYSTDLFRRDTVKRYLAYFEHLLGALPDHAARPIADIDILSEVEKRRLLEAFNAAGADYPREKTIVDLFEEQVQRTPEATALVVQDRALTYETLNAQANRLAHHLREDHGIGPDDRVALLLDRSEWMVIGMLGVLKAGGAYVPLDPEYPQDRTRFMVEDSGCKAVLTEESHRHRLDGLCETVDIAAVGRDPAGCTENPAHVNRPTDMAYVIYTSGSTGTPKGVLIEHRHVVLLMTNDKFPFDFSPDDVWTMFHSCCFDFSVWEMYGALLYGGKLVIVPRDIARDAEKFLTLLKEQRVTVLNQTPRAFYNLAALEAAASGTTLSLRYVIFGGEALKPAMLAAFSRRYPVVKLVNMYGITETTVHVTYKEITAAEIAADQSNIGRPIPTLSAYIMDGDLKLVPVGVPGELVVGGEGVARGYLNRPALTEEKFVSNPYKPEERLYRSGDLARMLPSGEIEYLGRIDHQVKIRGFRIELGEIETALLRHPDIAQAAVLAREDEGGDRFLCAYLVGEEDLPVEALRIHLGATLPDYMIPAQFLRIPKMPLTANGKIDSRALLCAEGEALTRETTFAAPQTENEALLAGIWEAVLGREKIGVLDNYFALGGDSIKAIQILARLKAHGLKLDVRHIFETPSIRELAKKLTAETRTARQGAISGPVPLTAIQTWFFDEHDGPYDHFTQAVLLRSPGPVDEAALERALLKLQAHHDGLRLRFRFQDGAVVQEMSGLDYPLSLTVVDLRDRPDAEAELDRRCAQIPPSFDLQAGPMMKAVLFRMAEGDRVLLVIHHLAVDGVSWRILLDDLGTCYRRAVAGQPLTLPPKTDAYGVWAEKIARYSASAQLSAEIPFWRQIAEAEPLILPPDAAAGDNRIQDVQTAFLELPPDLTRALLTQANGAYGTEVNDLLLAALGRAMQACYGKGRGVIAIEGHGRESLFEDIDIGRTVGWFTSIYPVLIDMPTADDPGLQIKQVKEGLRSIPRRGIGYGILKYLSPDAQRRRMPSGPRARILFNYLGRFDEGAEGGFCIDARTPANTVGGAFERPCEIEIEGAVIGQQLKLGLGYNPKIHTRETMDRFAQAYREALLCLVEHCVARNSAEPTPHDLTYKDLALPELEGILDASGLAAADLKDVYPLSPLQEGMLYHTLLESRSTAYCMQIAFAIEGDLDPAAFEAAWNRLAERHDILRTVFTHKGADRPLQIVSRRAGIDFRFDDISELSAARQRDHLAQFRAGDLEEGFDPTARMPMRVRLFKKAARSFEVVWSYHHLLIDGWGAGILMSEFFESYAALSRGGSPAAAPAPPYGDYIRWVEQLDRRATIDYWRTYLQGYERPARLPRRSAEENGDAFDSQTLVLQIDPTTLAGLKRFAAHHQVTLNTVVQTTWGLALSRHSGADDVVFGATVSGRPAQVAGIERMAGLFINTIPVRLRIDSEDTIGRLVRRVQADALQGEAHHYGSLADIQAATPLKGALLDHALVFENYPLAEELHGLEHRYALSFGIKDVHVFEQTDYDLTVVAEPGHETMRVEFRYNAAVFDRELMEQVKAAFGTIVEALADGKDARIDDLRRSLLSEAEQNEREAFIRSVQEISEEF